MFLALFLSLVLTAFVFVVVGPIVGFFALSLAVPSLLENIPQNLFFAYVGGAMPALLAGIVNWSLLLALHPQVGRLRLNLLSALASSVVASFIFGWRIIVEDPTSFLIFFLLCSVASVSCVFLTNKAARNILEDLGGSRFTP